MGQAKKMPHIAVVVDNELHADVRVLNQLNFLIAKGYRVSVHCFDHGNNRDRCREKLPGAELHYFEKSLRWKNKLRALSAWLPWYALAWARRIEAFCAAAQPDLLHVHDLYMAGAIRRKVLRIPVVLDLHENWPAAVQSYDWAAKWPNRWIVRPGRWRQLEAEYIARVDGLVVLSEVFKGELLRRVDMPDDKVAVYPNVPNLDMFDEIQTHEPTLSSLLDKTVLCYFGVCARRRGVTLLAEVLEKHPDPRLHLLLIGPLEKREEHELLPLINSLTKAGKMTWVPWISLHQLPAFMAVVDVGLSPIEPNEQHDSGVANKVFQYMYFEKPILVSASKAQAAIVAETDCGWVFEKFTQQSLRATLDLAIGQKSQWQAMGQRGKNAVLNRYNAGVQGQRITALYEKLLSGYSG